MSVRLPALLRLAAVCLAMLPITALAAYPLPKGPSQTLYRPYCPGTIGVDYAWPEYSDSPAVNKFRDEILQAIKSLYHPDAILPEEVVQIGDPPHSIVLPQGWTIAMDAFPGGYTTAVAIPPRDGPFADEVGLLMLLERKNALFGVGGAVSVPTGPQDLENGVRLPCSANDPTIRAPAILLGIPYQGG